MNKSIVFFNLGKMSAIASVLLVIPAVVSLIYRDGCLLSFLLPAAFMLVGGILLSLKKPKDKNSYAREGFVTVSVMWVLLSAVGALPFVFSGSIPAYIDAFFETVSGFTTTGSTILTDVEALPPSLHSLLAC